MENYKKYYGCCATYKDGKIVEIEDLYTNGYFPEGQIVTFVKCGKCDCMMDPKPKSYKCPKCGATVRWSKVMDAIQDENNEMEDYEDYY